MGVFDWFTKYSVSCDWACHRARGSRGGEDRRHPAGSPVLAPYDAVVTYGMYDDGASYVQFKYTNGYAHQAIHVQETTWRVPHGARVAAGTLCAASDGRKDTFGAGTSTGQHVHFQGHRPDGTRIPWTDVPAPTSQLAGVTHSPTITIEEAMSTSKEFLVRFEPRPGEVYIHAVGARFANGFTYLTSETDAMARADYWKMSDGSHLLEGLPVFDCHDNQRAFDLIKELHFSPPTTLDMSKVDVSEEDIAGRVVVALTPTLLAQQITAAGIAAEVSDELAKRLAGNA